MKACSLHFIYFTQNYFCQAVINYCAGALLLLREEERNSFLLYSGKLIPVSRVSVVLVRVSVMFVTEHRDVKLYSYIRLIFI